jgi:hypothetical protein
LKTQVIDMQTVFYSNLFFEHWGLMIFNIDRFPYCYFTGKGSQRGGELKSATSHASQWE